MAFEKLELKSASCFGWRPPSREGGGSKCWFDIAEESIAKRWNDVDVRQLERDLAMNVESCYFNIARGEFVDLDTEFRWRAQFINDHMMWKLDLPDSPKTEVLPEDAAEFFKSDYFKKFSKRCGDLIDRAVKRFRQTVEPHLDDGELLMVQEEKLSRILYDAETKRFMENLRGGKYELE